VDLLGYFIDLESPVFRAAEAAALADLTARTETWCGVLSAAGYPVGLSDLLTLNPRYPGTLQLIQAVQARGYRPDFDSAARLVQQHRAGVPDSAQSLAQAIAIIHATGGAAVLAHPGARNINWRGQGLIDALGLGQLVDLGLDGLEVYHFTLDQAERQHFLALARQFDLLVTGGSDEHGWPDGFRWLGCQPVSMGMVARLAERAGRYPTTLKRTRP
jgi:predicted metal-dependent phosphoesterase TrpH